MTERRHLLASASFMSVANLLLAALAVRSIGVNAPALYGASAGALSAPVLTAAAWLAAPVVLTAIPAWYLARARERLGEAGRRIRLVRWFTGAWMMNALALGIVVATLFWHSGAGPDAPKIDLPIYVLSLWMAALAAYVPAFMALRERRRERDREQGGEH